jgi:hypothetical protein
LEAVGATKFLAEAFDAAGGVDELLLAGEERMTGAANIDIDFGQRAACDECISTSTMYGAGLITGMNFAFHDELPTDRTCVQQNTERQPTRIAS